MAESRGYKRLIFEADGGLADGVGLSEPQSPAVTVALKTLSGVRGLISTVSDAKARRARAADAAAAAEERHELEARLKEYVEADLAGGLPHEANGTYDASLKGRRPGEDAGADLAQGKRAQSDLQAELKRTRTELTQAREALESERAAWETTRQKLEGRLHEKLAPSQIRTELEAALDGSRKQLREATSTHTAELKARVDELNTVAAERTALKAALETAQAESRKATEKFASDRMVLETTRGELNVARQELTQRDGQIAAMTEAHAKMETALAQSQASLQQHLEQYGAERADWEARYRDLDAALKTATTKLTTATDAHASDRAAWDTARQELETRLQNPEAAQQDRQPLEQALQEALAKHAQLLSAHESLERQMAEAKTRLHQMDDESEALRMMVDTEFHGDVRAELEARLQEARRLEEVGRLAGAMTPDLKELVASIDRCGTELARLLESSDPRRESAQDILGFSERASILLRQLLSFSEKQSKPLARVDVNDAVRRAEPVLSQVAGVDIELKIVLGPPSVISAGDDDIEHLVTAMVFSARDLLPVGGSLTIETRRDSKQPGADQDQPGGAFGHVLLLVKAVGYGVQPAQASSALELAVQRCGGELYFDGTVGRGAVLQVRFALARPDAPTAAADAAPSAARAESTGVPAKLAAKR